MNKSHAWWVAAAALLLSGCAQITAADADLPAPAASVANTATNGQSVTFAFTAAPDFLNGDVLTGTWGADAVSILGSHYTAQKTSTYSFRGRVGK